jgi:transaldolase/glucose-6-phosphate isomerase
LITGGELRRLIDEDGLRGVTSNPAIFEKAITGSSDYRAVLEQFDVLALDAKSIYERLAVQDIRDAADALRPVYDDTSRRDGYVSLEVSPVLAYDTAGTLDEARRLWRAVGRDNLMIKVPATPQGIPAIQELIGEGINVNVTLLFAQDAYERVAEAFIAGLETYAARGGDLKQVASVASFFISRIDTAIDTLIAARLQAGTDANESSVLRGLTGKVAIANAKLTYQRYQELFSGRRWQALAGQGAQTQRLLWASTGTKDPRASDVLYIEALAAPDTINTMPDATLLAFADHGQLGGVMPEDGGDAESVLAEFERAGIDVHALAEQLQRGGAEAFVKSWNALLERIAAKSEALAAR